MSKEEIIEKLNSIVKVHNDFLKDVKKETINEKEIQAIQGLLGLYQKEKEQNKKLKELLQKKNKYTHEIEKDLFENCSNYVVDKNKIREKIREYDEHNYQEAAGALQELIEDNYNHIPRID